MNRFWAAGLLCFATTAAAAHASMITDVETIGGRNVAASADFNMSADTLTLTLDNLTAQTADASQLLSGITFTLNNGTNVISSAGFTATGSERTVFGDGTYVDSGSKNLSWELLPGNVMQIDFHPDARDALIGPANSETASNPGIYSANSSIMGNAGHNPFGAETATFTLTNPELLATTTVSDITFLWGTSLSPGETVPGAFVPDITAPIPEPASISVLACSTLLLLRRKRRG